MRRSRTSNRSFRRNAKKVSSPNHWTPMRAVSVSSQTGLMVFFLCLYLSLSLFLSLFIRFSNMSLVFYVLFSPC